MNKLFILLAILAVVSCRPMFVLDTLTNAFDTGTTWSKEYQKPDWDNQLDFAVYGWMKIDPNLSRGAWSVIFMFTSNPPSTFAGWTTIGDQVLSCYILSNIFQCPTYNKATSDPNLRQNWNFINDDVGQWAFWYMGYGSNQQKASVYGQFKYTIVKYQMPNVVHYPSAYYKLFVGQAWTWKYFQGTIAKVFIDSGPSAYREDNWQAIQQIRPDTPNRPVNVPKCIAIYDQCYYQGNTVQICNKIPSLDLNKVKSIYLPAGSSFTLYGGAQYQGNQIKFTENQPCIDIIETWSFAQIASGMKTFKASPKEPREPKKSIRGPSHKKHSSK